MKYYIIAGEASGDLHGSNLIKEIIKLDSNAEIKAWGGDKMQDAGAIIVARKRSCFAAICNNNWPHGSNRR